MPETIKLTDELRQSVAKTEPVAWYISTPLSSVIEHVKIYRDEIEEVAERYMRDYGVGRVDIYPLYGAEPVEVVGEDCEEEDDAAGQRDDADHLRHRERGQPRPSHGVEADENGEDPAEDIPNAAFLVRGVFHKPRVAAARATSRL